LAQILDIYSTSIDYDPNQDMSIEFFKKVQNKMHWAAHGNTASEIIFKRVDANKPNLGLTNFKGEKPTKQEIEIAKNYLSENELNILNRIVAAYLEFAELQALNQNPMYMSDWIEKLDDFLKLSGKDVLDNPGKISHNIAIEKANKEYSKYKENIKNELSKGEKDYLKRLEIDFNKISKNK